MAAAGSSDAHPQARASHAHREANESSGHRADEHRGVVGCPRAKAAPLISDGDEIASIGTVQVITPHTLPERKI